MSGENIGYIPEELKDYFKLEEIQIFGFEGAIKCAKARKNTYIPHLDDYSIEFRDDHLE